MNGHEVTGSGRRSIAALDRVLALRARWHRDSRALRLVRARLPASAGDVDGVVRTHVAAQRQLPEDAPPGRARAFVRRLILERRLQQDVEADKIDPGTGDGEESQ